MGQQDTIAAIATAVAPSGIGIIRMSGEKAFEVADQIFLSLKTDKKVSEMDSHTVHYGQIHDDGDIIDEVLLLVMRGPHTYTREDTVEIDTHGGILVMRRILDTVFKYGARPAEPGEFTKRAFLNGRIDLTQAESVIEIINAKNSFALESSVKNLRGDLKDAVISLRDKILYEVAFIESALDDPEHYTLDGYYPKLSDVVDEVKKEADRLIRTADEGRMLREGIQTAIIGKPNAGKSSLLNLLSGEDRAIVTEFAGTTRDTLTEQIMMDGISLNIVDTAGIRRTSDPIEQIGVKRSKDALADADLILYMIDSTVSFDDSDRDIIRELRGKKAICLMNKIDRAPHLSEERVKSFLSEEMKEEEILLIPVSMKDGTGIDDLKSTIKQEFFKGEIRQNDEVYITNLRQKNALVKASESLSRVKKSIADKMPEDFLTIDLMDAYTQLGSIIGASIEDDLADKIFSEFCMGK